MYLLIMQMPVDQIAYSQRYSDDQYEYRYVASKPNVICLLTYLFVFS